MTRNHVYNDVELHSVPYNYRYKNKKVVIGNFCWLGARVTILSGITIGDEVVIDAGSVVTYDVPKGSVIAENPSKILKYRGINKFGVLVKEGKDISNYRKERYD